MHWFKKIHRTISHLFHPQRSNNYRPRILHPESILALSSILVIIGLALFWFTPNLSEKIGSVLGYASDINVASVIAETNDQRVKLGLRPLTKSPLLTLAAQKKAANMFQQQYWAHIAPDGTKPWHFMKVVGYDYRYAGENLAKDFAVTDDMVAAWMRSPKHRQNILNPKYTEIGVAVTNGVLHGVETTLVVQMFGQPRRVLPAITTGATAPVNKLIAKVKQRKAAQTNQSETQVLAQTTIRYQSIELQPHYSPLILVKSFLFSIGFMLIVVLIYDLLMIQEKHTFRLVGKNLAHLLLLGTVMFLIFYFKAGTIG